MLYTNVILQRHLDQGLGFELLASRALGIQPLLSLSRDLQVMSLQNCQCLGVMSVVTIKNGC